MVWKCLSSKKKHTKTSSQFNSTIELMDDPITTRFSIMCYKFFSSKKFLLFQSWFTFFFAFFKLCEWQLICVLAFVQQLATFMLASCRHCMQSGNNKNQILLHWLFEHKKKLRISVFNRYTFIDFILLFFNNLTVSVVVLKFFNYRKTSIINGFWYKITDRNVYSLRRCLLYIHIIYQ